MTLSNKLQRILTKKWWKVEYHQVWLFHPHQSGFNALTTELSNAFTQELYSKERGERILTLQQVFRTPAEENEDGVKSFTEGYHKYKREYVKHLSFNPEEENLSKYVLD